ncbi:stage II sporulation E family protein [Oscillochloris trichoides DG-6]|uniref:Stage II sporulation E family protein n=1 Tax=Oscillochloris trichoides DG-6 TaxID=765420 RepID=E1IB22_9CHLR|nr:GAF domain-containing SpoIIE family protein phosphatase [Oscillochloris trichoides]EFO81668.1 stage II sporulation E family protein [Oscillochloris trichoides DG-6]
MPAPDSQQRIAELTALNGLAQTLNQTLDLREALDAALGQICRLIGLHSAWIFLRGEGDTFLLAARHDLPPALSYPGPAWNAHCTCQDQCAAAQLDKPVTMVRCSRLDAAVGDKWGLTQHASVPLRSGDEVLGILNVATTQWGRIATAELQLLAAIGWLLGTAIARAQLYAHVKVRRVQEQRALLSLSQDLLVSEELEPALQRLVRVGARLLEADACAFVEADELGGRAILRAAFGWNVPPQQPWPLLLDPASPHLWYLPERASMLADAALTPLPALLATQAFHGHLGIAVDLGGAPVGTLMVNSRAPRQFLDDEAQLLGLLANQLAQTLERERLHQEALARQRLEQELDLAREIQASFLPHCCPTLPGYQISAYYRAARQVGGDFYDFIELPPPPGSVPSTPGSPPRRGETVFRAGRLVSPDPQDLSSAQRLGIVIADVTDKGVPAALFMALSRTLLRATAIDGRQPAEVLQRANRLILADSRSGLFVTCFYLTLEVASGHITYANGGHNYPLHYATATGQVQPLRARGIVLGIVPDPQFDQHELTLQPGDVVVLYTDGVTEAMNPARELFGDERLHALLHAHAQRSPHEIINAVLTAVTEFAAGQAQSDDITLVVLKRNPLV